MRLFMFAATAAVLTLCTLSVRAQTTTIIDGLGQTIVEVITIDPDLGVPTTQTLQTLTTTATTTPPLNQGQVGPVGAPQTQNNAGPIEYTYTTTDGSGNTIATLATFTPTFAPTAGGSITAPAGTVINYSSWRQSVGSNTVAAVSNSATRWTVKTRWVGVGAALCAGLTGGVWLAFA